ncbi:MAG: hypothetical protein V4683_20460 [Bacteroidota bacterium]
MEKLKINFMEAVLTKEDLQKQMDSLPEKFRLDDLVEKLIIVEKINLAKQQILEGKFISDEDLDQIIEKW